MLINRNSNIIKALSIFKIGKINNSTKGKSSKNKGMKLDCVIDEVIESKYISRNFQIGVTYVQIAKSTLTETKNTLLEMKEIFDKCKNQDNTSFTRESLNVKFEELCKKFNTEANKLTIDLKENLFYNNNNELVFRVFDSKDLDECILIPKLDANKLILKGINIKNELNADDAYKKMEKALDYILSSEKLIKSSEEKLSKVNLTDIMSVNLMALSSNQNKESIEKLIEMTRLGLTKEGNTYLKDIKRKNIDDILN